MLRGRPNVRIICMSESHDFEHWTPREIIVRPDEHDPPQDHEFYGMSSLAYRDLRIGFLSVFHTLNEGWIAQNQIEEWMPEWMNRMDVQLTYSKDGRAWHRAGTVKALARVYDKTVGDAFVRLLPGEDETVRGEMIAAIGKAGDTSRLKALMAVVEQPTLVSTKLAWITTMMKLHPNEARPVLEKWAASPDANLAVKVREALTEPAAGP